MYPGMAKTARDEGFADDRRVVRDARQGREVARRPLPEGARRPREALARGGPARVKVAPPERAVGASSRFGDPDYLDPAKLERELRRVGDICHQCRRCLPLCPPFPKLFELIDATARRGRRRRHARGFEAVNELCYHCKLCYNHCPYTPPHEWDVDFPALMRRQQVARAQRDGIPLARRLTTRTDLIGKLGSLAPPLMNFANRNRAVARADGEDARHRPRLGAALVLLRDGRPLVRAPRARAATGANGRVVLFTTCTRELQRPDRGRARPSRCSSTATCASSSATSAAAACRSPTPATSTPRARNAERNVADLLPVRRGAARRSSCPGPPAR